MAIRKEMIPTGNIPPPTTRTCLCSPTTHPGSFRCHLHRNSHHSHSHSRHSYHSHPNNKRVVSQNYWELAVMTKANSLKAFLLQIIKPSNHDLQRRKDFQPKPSRFYLLNFHQPPHHHLPVS